MEIQLCDVGKRFRYEWIIKKFSYTFNHQQHYALLGPNGSGKSTLMKILSGHLSPSAGKIKFLLKNPSKDIPLDSVYRQISFASPYIELVEEFTLTEMLDFHQRFKSFQPGIDNQTIIDIMRFEKSRHKEVRFFSSGMKQRLKLALAICADTPLLLLDEPTTNLDAQGAVWFREILQIFGQNRTVVVATNVDADHSFFCDQQINILDYK
ncbi:MAG: ABC transporter ATP-binding protein [Saprospiraceae bacterium]